MKKFHLFVGKHYYPTGFGDYVASYELLDDAVTAGSTWWGEDWYEVAETVEDGSLRKVCFGSVKE